VSKKDRFHLQGGKRVKLEANGSGQRTQLPSGSNSVPTDRYAGALIIGLGFLFDAEGSVSTFLRNVGTSHLHGVRTKDTDLFTFTAIPIY
jgi:hypothetical protein